MRKILSQIIIRFYESAILCMYFFVKFNIDYNICNQISNDEEFLSDNLNGVLTQSHAFLLALQNFTLFGIPYIFFYLK